MADLQKANGTGEGAVSDVVGGQAKTTNNSSIRGLKFSTGPEILTNKSTATEVQLAKVIALLRQGPKTTIELRSHAIMQPAARVFQLKYEHGYNITTELLALYDAEGVRHRKCARYHLNESESGGGL